MRGKALLCLVVLCLMVGVVSADTLILYAEHDGYVSEGTPNTGWYTLRNGVGDAQIDSPSSAQYNYAALAGTTTDGEFNYNGRTIETFNASNLGSGTTINSAVLSIKVATRATRFDATSNLSLIDIDPANKLDFTGTDYSTTTFTRFANDIEYASVSTSNYNNLTLNSLGLSNISKTGLTSFAISHSVDVDNGSVTWQSSTGLLGFTIRPVSLAGSEPILTIDYTPSTPPDTTPPASITNLVNDTYECDLVNWSWINPEDIDFDLVQVYQNGTFFHNVTTAYDNWTGLEELTEYEIATHTCDATGNCNTTFINATFITSSCSGAVIPVASFISNATCGNVPFVVQFNDTSLNVPIFWNWSFGDGNFSEDQNPLFIYNSSGLYSINFNATNDAGTGWSNRTNYIRAVPDWYSCPIIITPTPWQPEIMPSTEFDARLDNLVPYWWIPAIFLVGWILFRKG